MPGLTVAFDRKAYMKAYVRDPKNRAAQWASCDRYRAKMMSTQEGRKKYSDAKKAYAATPVGKRNIRNNILKHHYGITLDEYEEMMRDQGGLCAICGGVGRTDRDSPLDVDHNHETGDVRALLCVNCNHGLGKFKDDIERLEKAIAYLREHS